MLDIWDDVNNTYGVTNTAIFMISSKIKPNATQLFVKIIELQ